jgi:16S rRNA (guanine527-N7)-methyltransferase
MKGMFPAEEISCLPPDVMLESQYRLSVPGIEAERHLIVLRPSGTEQPVTMVSEQ